MTLPPPPAGLAGPPRAFYDALRAVVAELAPPALDAVETDFGDAGVAVTLRHAHEDGWTLTAQCSRRAAVVFAGPTATHFDERADGWTEAAVAFIASLLRGERALELAGRRGRAGETLRIDFGA